MKTAAALILLCLAAASPPALCKPYPARGQGVVLSARDKGTSAQPSCAFCGHSPWCKPSAGQYSGYVTPGYAQPQPATMAAPATPPPAAATPAAPSPPAAAPQTITISPWNIPAIANIPPFGNKTASVGDTVVFVWDQATHGLYRIPNGTCPSVRRLAACSCFLTGKADRGIPSIYMPFAAN